MIYIRVFGHVASFIYLFCRSSLHFPSWTTTTFLFCLHAEFFITHLFPYVSPSLPHTGAYIFVQGLLHGSLHLPGCRRTISLFSLQATFFITHSFPYVLPSLP